MNDEDLSLMVKIAMFVVVSGIILGIISVYGLLGRKLANQQIEISTTSNKIEEINSLYEYQYSNLTGSDILDFMFTYREIYNIVIIYSDDASSYYQIKVGDKDRWSKESLDDELGDRIFQTYNFHIICSGSDDNIVEVAFVNTANVSDSETVVKKYVTNVYKTNYIVR